MNRFTLTIHNRGWKVLEACEYWGIRYATYNARCNNPRLHNQLESMCLGLSHNQLEYKSLGCNDIRGLELKECE